MTLAEITLSLALATVVIFIALRAFSQAQENSRMQQTAAEVGQVHTAIESTYATIGNFAGLNETSIATAMPASLVSADQTKIFNPYQGQVHVAPDQITSTGGAYDSYDIAIDGLTQDACMRLATIDIGRSLASASAGAGKATLPLGKPDPSATVPMKPDAARSVCKGGSSYFVAYLIH
jgi:Tfp pilus assembly protein PilE